MSRHWYEHWLQQAHFAERAGRLESAVALLGRAEKHTFDPDELYHLNCWRNRLQRDIAKAVPPAIRREADDDA